MTNKKQIIGLVFGGESSEHEVSIKSAETIYAALSHSCNIERFIVNPIYINWIYNKTFNIARMR